MTDEEYEELQRSDRKAQIREWSFVQFAPFWQRVMRVCVSYDRASGKQLLDLETVKLWLNYLDAEIERLYVMHDIEDEAVEQAVYELSEVYIRLEEARQVRVRRARAQQARPAR